MICENCGCELEGRDMLTNGGHASDCQLIKVVFTALDNAMENGFTVDEACVPLNLIDYDTGAFEILSKMYRMYDADGEFDSNAAVELLENIITEWKTLRGHR